MSWTSNVFHSTVYILFPSSRSFQFHHFISTSTPFIRTSFTSSIQQLEWSSQTWDNSVPSSPANCWVRVMFCRLIQASPFDPNWYLFRPTDFLPVKCDACSSVFCNNHFTYTSHNCPNAYLKDNQVPVCPLCNQPVPVARGVLPDVGVSQHIDNECQDDRATKNRSSRNKCNVKGCKIKELVPVLCSDCKVNFCLKHRHPSDHNCDPRSKRIPKSVTVTSSASSLIRSTAAAAAGTATNASRKITEYFNRNVIQSNGNNAHASNSLSEDEALAIAIQASLSESNPVPNNNQNNNNELQEEEDRQLAQAIAESQATSGQRRFQSSSADRCSLNWNLGQFFKKWHREPF